MVKRTALVFALLIAATSTLVAETTWKTDLAHSAVKFTVAHLVISEVEGSFKSFDATFTTSKDDLSDATLTATIKVASISTDNEKRDNHLKSPDFLDAAKYPDMTFKSTSFSKTGEATYKIAGDLTIRGVTKPVVLDAVYKGRVQAWGKTVIALSATTEINRFDFGAKWDATIETGGLVAGEKVKIAITFEGTK
jgi:polyisoprenoid-binding protein YceI